MAAHSWKFLRFMVFFTTMVGGLHWYVWRRLIGDAIRARTWKQVATGLYFLCIAGFLAGGMAGRFAMSVAPHWALWFGNVWIGVLVLATISVGTLDLMRWLASRRVRPQQVQNPERRVFLARTLAGTATAATASLSGIGLYEGLRRVQVKQVEVTLDRLPAEADGYRIAQVTDMHVGPTLGRDFVETVVAEVQALRPNLIAVTGDLVDGDVDELEAQLAPLRGLAAPDGVFYVTGNHEYYWGAEAWIRHLPSFGLRPLMNERLTLPHFDLAGVPDWTAKDFPGSVPASLKTTLAGRDESRTLVLLAHQPKHFWEASNRGVDLQLSGHTHGGQMFPLTVLIHLAYPFIQGLYRRKESQIYVSAGTGYWGPPMRLGTEAEVTCVVLKRAV